MLDHADKRWPRGGKFYGRGTAWAWAPADSRFERIGKWRLPLWNACNFGVPVTGAKCWGVGLTAPIYGGSMVLCSGRTCSALQLPSRCLQTRQPTEPNVISKRFMFAYAFSKART
jgi:hypothetical protein